MRIEKVFLAYEITPAQLLYKSSPAQMQISVERGGMQMESEPMLMKLDNKQFFDSIGITDNQTRVQENARAGKEAAVEAVGRYTRQKNAMMGPDAVSISQIAAQQGREPVKTALAFLPEEKPKARWSGGEVNMRFIKDKVEISWKPNELEFTYVPYSVDYRVEKR
jgi:hypothetical protein